MSNSIIYKESDQITAYWAIWLKSTSTSAQDILNEHEQWMAKWRTYCNTLAPNQLADLRKVLDQYFNFLQQLNDTLRTTLKEMMDAEEDRLEQGNAQQEDDGWNKLMARLHACTEALDQKSLPDRDSTFDGSKTASSYPAGLVYGQGTEDGSFSSVSGS